MPCPFAADLEAVANRLFREVEYALAELAPADQLALLEALTARCDQRVAQIEEVYPQD